MKFFQLSVVAASVALLGSATAYAGTWDMGLGRYSTIKVDGKSLAHENFELVDTDPKGGLDLTYYGTTRRGDPFYPTGNDWEQTCSAAGMTNRYMCIIGNTNNPGNAVLDLSGTAVDYYGFRWGTIDWPNLDRLNIVKVWESDGQLTTVRGWDARAKVKAAGGTNSGFFNFYADQGETITKVELWTYVRSFETDNHVVATLQSPALASAISPVSAVPEPSTYALLLGGLGIVGWAARRRRT